MDTVDLDAFPGSQEKLQEFIEPQIETVSIRCLKPMIVKIVGAVTLREYVFNGAGSIVDVDKRDVDSILSRNRSIQSCCGTYSSPYFDTL